MRNGSGQLHCMCVLVIWEHCWSFDRKACTIGWCVDSVMLIWLNKKIGHCLENSWLQSACIPKIRRNYVWNRTPSASTIPRPLSMGTCDDPGEGGEGGGGICSVCTRSLGKRYLRPKHFCRLCTKPVCQQCCPTTSSQEGGPVREKRICALCTDDWHLAARSKVKLRPAKVGQQMRIIAKVDVDDKTVFDGVSAN